MIFAHSKIVEAIAAALTPLQYPVYDSAMRQEVDTPCFFISLMPGDITKDLGNRYTVNASYDIVFLQRPNVLNAMDGVYSVLDYLHEHLMLLNYSENNITTQILTHNRRYHLQDLDLHYQIDIHERVSIPESFTEMQGLEVEIEVETE